MHEDLTHCKHDGPHNVGWYWGLGGEPDPNYRIADAIKQALNHVWEEDVEPGDLDKMHELLGRIDRRMYMFTDRSVPFWVTDEEREVIHRVMWEACAYMGANDYAGDLDFPEDAHAARTLTDGLFAWQCWVDADAAAAKARKASAEYAATRR